MARGVWLLCANALCVVACFSPKLPDGQLVCDAVGACPTGLECAADGLCYREPPIFDCAPPPVEAACVVPGTHETVQAAVQDEACPSVLLRARTYYEQIEVPRQLVLYGHCATLDGQGQGPVVTVSGGPVEIFGLTIVGGQATYGGGIFSTAELTLVECTIQGNQATGNRVEGAGIYTTARLELDNTVVADNVATASGVNSDACGAGISSHDSNLVIRHSEIRGNRAVASADPNEQARACGGGVTLYGGSLTVEEGSLLADNVVSATGDILRTLGGGAYVAEGSMVLAQSVVSGNQTVGTHGGSASALDHYGNGGGLMIDNNATLQASGSEIRDNLMSGADMRLGEMRGGGVSARSSSVQIDDCTISGNVTVATTTRAAPTIGAWGGGLSLVASFGGAVTADITDSLIQDNRVELSGGGVAQGGGIYGLSINDATVGNALQITVKSSRFTQNRALSSSTSVTRAEARGGGIAVAVRPGTPLPTLDLVLEASTLDDNLTQITPVAETVTPGSYGGGLWAGSATSGSGTLTVGAINTTWSNNRALSSLAGFGRGGGLFFERLGTPLLNATLRNVTITQNSSTLSGGGLSTAPLVANPVGLDITSSIVYGNTSGTQAECSLVGTRTNFGRNLFGSSDCAPTVDDTVEVDPLLLPLGAYGGKTPTHVLDAASPAIQLVQTGGCKTLQNLALLVDQRALPRLASANACDFGAVSRQATDPSLP